MDVEERQMCLSWRLPKGLAGHLGRRMYLENKQPGIICICYRIGQTKNKANDGNVTNYIEWVWIGNDGQIENNENRGELVGICVSDHILIFLLVKVAFKNEEKGARCNCNRHCLFWTPPLSKKRLAA